MKELQSLPLERKIQITQTRIIEWYQHYNGAVYVSFSGGKDSTVLLHIARQLFPDIKAVFSNTGLEYPEIQKQVIKTENVDIIRPEMRFDEVICEYGYPLISKEVAEAIHFARRIHSHSVNVERERELPSAEEKSCRETDYIQANRNARQKNFLIKTSTARNRRTVLSGRMSGVAEVAEEPG